jgi:hypothetical protein
MTHLFIVLSKVLVRTFYKINAGFFLVVLGLCFGFLRKIEHIALAQFFVSSPYLLLLPILLWLLYTIKVVLYNRHAVAFPQNTFLGSFLFLQRRKRVVLLILIAVLQLLPIILYGFFLFSMAYGYQFYSIMYSIAGILGGMIILVAFSMHRNLFYQTRGRPITLIKRIFDSKFTKPRLQFFIEWVIRTQPAIFFGAKLFACAVIIGISRLYLFDEYDVRLMSLSVMLAAAANIGLTFQFHRFENYHFQWMKNLPISLAQRILFFLFTFIIVSMPEWIVLLRFFPSQLSLFHYVELVIFGISLIFLAYTSLFIQYIAFEKLTQYMFYCFIGLMLLILFKVPILLLSGIQFFVGIYFIRKYYYTYGLIAGEE